MTSSESETSADFDWVFPYGVLWHGYGNEKITLWMLQQYAGEYETLNSTIGFFDSDAPTLSVEQVQTFAALLDITSERRAEFSHNVWLASCFYLAPVHAEILGHNRAAVGELLNKIAEAAKTLDELLGHLPPKVDAAMFFLRPMERDAILPDGPPFWKAKEEIHDLALVAGRMADQIAATGGRPSEIVRDTAIELLLTELHEARVYDLRISDGTKLAGHTWLASLENS